MLDICLWFLIFTHSVRKVWIKKRLASVSGYRICTYIRIAWRVVKTQIAQGCPKISEAIDPRTCISQKGPDGADVIALTPHLESYWSTSNSPAVQGGIHTHVWFQNLYCFSWYKLLHAECPKWTLCLHISVPSLPLGSPSGSFHPFFMTQPNVSTSRKFFFSEGMNCSFSVFPGFPMQNSVLVSFMLFSCFSDHSLIPLCGPHERDSPCFMCCWALPSSHSVTVDGTIGWIISASYSYT